MPAKLVLRLALALVVALQPVLASAQVGPVPQAAVGVSVAPLTGGKLPAANLDSVAVGSLPSGSALTGSEIIVLNQGGGDVQVTLSTLAAFLGTTVTATAAGTPVTVPGSSSVGTAITGLTTTLTPSNATAYASLTIAGTEQTPRSAFAGTSVPSMTPLTSGSATIKIWAASTGGSALATSASFTIASAPATAYTSVLSASSVLVGSAVTLTLTPTGTWPSGETITPSAASISGTFSPTSGTPSAGTTTALAFTFTPSAAGSGTLTSSASPAMTNTTGTRSLTAIAAATAYTTTLSASSGTTGSPVTMTFTPTSGGWPNSEVITPTVTTLTGTFSPTTVSTTAGSTAAVTATFTPSAAATGSLSSSTSPSLTNTTGALAYTASAGASVPGQVTSVVLGTPTSTSMPMTWTAPGSGGTPTGFIVELSSNGGTSFGTPITVGTWDTYYVATGLTVGTSYIARVTATNGSGSGTVSANSAAVSTLASGANYVALTAPATATAGTDFTVTYTTNITGAGLTITFGGTEWDPSGNRQFVSLSTSGGSLPTINVPFAGTYTIRIYSGSTLMAESRPITVTGTVSSQNYSVSPGGTAYTVTTTPAIPTSVARGRELYISVQIRNTSTSALDTNGGYFAWDTASSGSPSGGSQWANNAGTINLHFDSSSYAASTRYLWLQSGGSGFNWFVVNSAAGTVVP